MFELLFGSYFSFSIFLLLMCCTNVQCAYSRHISYVFIIRKPPHKPSHITKAYQNTLRNTTVEHKNMSIHKITIKNQYFKHILSLKRTVQHVHRKTAQAPSNLKKKFGSTAHGYSRGILSTIINISLRQ